MNTEKTCVMHFGNDCIKDEYFIGGIPLKYVDTYKDLGTIKDRNLNFVDHYHKIGKKVGCLTNTILRAFKGRSNLDLYELFCIYIRPIIEYNSIISVPSFYHSIKYVENF